ncbi:hypothetical protein SAMN06265182_1723 [Persephonella hydrogeniphila]|uniref:Uncharacterized protein n=1 Tax=Persephonella hydrogeniphila TaxID=198703 RepID=A0A285NMD2_9AQUI|nr:hypothetical protein [Persephonella hydrogeniphila]SNZ10083.1 hypothetical protein SAMN06265182_1723 [Persephonella hydrogeniphila]
MGLYDRDYMKEKKVSYKSQPSPPADNTKLIIAVIIAFILGFVLGKII